MLPRYLHYARTGQWLDPSIALLSGGCTTVNCQNPRHFIPSRKRTMTPARKKQYRKENR